MDLTKTALGIELGSTRIKAVLIDDRHLPVASGDFEWENRYVDGIWTYPMELVHTGVQSCFARLKDDVKEKYGVELTTVGAIGVSAMMHGYLPFDGTGKQLAEFRTWRNTITGEAAEKLTALFGFNIPQRWSIAHQYQAILNGEEHVKHIAYLTTLAGYLHWKLTGEKFMGVGEASGMFPIDSAALDYDEDMVRKFEALTGVRLRAILPKVLPAGVNAGYLTEAGARFLDPTGTLLPGIPFAPCEGDAGTGMAATNSVRVRTGNVSAGTSDFAMIVTDKPLGVHREIDMVTTPDGLPVAMVHCNNCTSDINAWVSLFKEYQQLLGVPVDMNELYGKLFNKALEGDTDCGGLMAYNYVSGEPVTGLSDGRPLFVRSANDKFNLANFMRAHLYGAIGVLKIGNDILLKEEKIKVDRITGHGGYFKTAGVGQRMLAAALNSPISVMETAGEGGAWGIALLAGYLINNNGKSLADYLEQVVFAGNTGTSIAPTADDVAGFERYIENYKRCLPVEQAAVANK